MNRRGFFRGLGAAALAAPIAAWSAGAPRREGVHLEGATIYGSLTLSGLGPFHITNCTITAPADSPGIIVANAQSAVFYGNTITP